MEISSDSDPDVITDKHKTLISLFSNGPKNFKTYTELIVFFYNMCTHFQIDNTGNRSSQVSWRCNTGNLQKARVQVSEFGNIPSYLYQEIPTSFSQHIMPPQVSGSLSHNTSVILPTSNTSSQLRATTNPFQSFRQSSWIPTQFSASSPVSIQSLGQSSAPSVVSPIGSNQNVTVPSINQQVDQPSQAQVQEMFNFFRNLQGNRIQSNQELPNSGNNNNNTQ